MTVGDSVAGWAVQKVDLWVDGKADAKVGLLAAWWVVEMV